MNYLYIFPKNAAYGKVLPKNKIYEHAVPSNRIKKLFIREIEKIVWSYKLSPETVNLPAKGNVQEIQIFTVIPKSRQIDYDILSVIDKSVPSPIIFVLNYENKSRYVAAYKRQNEADKNKLVISRYFETDWISDDVKKTPIPVVLDIEALYYTLLNSIISITARQNETINDYVTRAELIYLNEREAAMIESRLEKEKQFNRKVEINTELKKIKDELKKLKNI
jgi:hypothetical protein